MKLFVVIWFVLTANRALTQFDLYAGLEVGSKGTKLCIIDNTVDSAALTDKIIFDTTINTDFIKFSSESDDATIEAVNQLYWIAFNRYIIQNKNIFIAISSGVKQTAERENKIYKIANLISSIKILLGDQNKNIEVISVAKESLHSHKSIVPEKNKMKTIVIDIGSGNTKGGYYITKNLFNTFNVAWGTKTVHNYVMQTRDSHPNDAIFFLELQKKLSEISTIDIPVAIDKCGITNFDFNIVFSGGIAWAVANLIKPKYLKDKTVTITHDELNNFYNKVNKQYDEINQNITSEDFIKEKKKIEQVFNRRSIMSGTGLLLKIMRKFEPSSNAKKFIFIKDNKSGYLPSYIMESVQDKPTSRM